MNMVCIKIVKSGESFFPIDYRLFLETMRTIILNCKWNRKQNNIFIYSTRKLDLPGQRGNQTNGSFTY